MIGERDRKDTSQKFALFDFRFESGNKQEMSSTFLVGADKMLTCLFPGLSSDVGASEERASGRG